MRTRTIVLFVAAIAAAAALGASRVQAQGAAEAATEVQGVSTVDLEEDADPAFPKGIHHLAPHPRGERVAFGKVDPAEELAQPIAYSHKLHAGTLGIQCEYCHSGARRSIHAGVPATQVCMNCHGGAVSVDATGRPELEKLKEYFAKGEPIPWRKVHDLPDFVYFSHKRHVRAGVTCQECHGDPAKDFTVARRVNTLQMGWCLDCHARHPTVDANYGAEAELRRAELKDCVTCHK